MEWFHLFKILCIFWIEYLLGIHVLATETPEPNLRIDSIKVHTEVKLRFAKSIVTGHVTNPTNGTETVQIRLFLPVQTFLSDIKMEMNGTIYTGQIKQKDFTKYPRGPGQRTLESFSQAGDSFDSFDFMINLPKQTEVQFSLICQKLLHRRHGRYHLTFSIMTSHDVDEYDVQVEIEETRNITYLSVNNQTEFDETISTISTKPSQFMLRYHKKKPLMPQQTTFRVEYDLERLFDLGDTVISGDYFVHFFAPILESEIPKSILFILDKSGSMAHRLHKLKMAMHKILNDLKETDEFGIIMFEAEVEFMYMELVNASFENIDLAMEYIDNLTANGGTNIKSALLHGLYFLNADQNTGFGSKMIFFLTDGAIFGIKNKALIEIKVANIYDIPIYSLAFGKDADTEFLQQLSRQNNGESRQVNDNEEAIKDITDLFKDIPSTLLKNVSFHYPFFKEAWTSPLFFPNYLNGTEISVAGLIVQHAENSSNTPDVDFVANEVELDNITKTHTYIVLKSDEKICPTEHVCLPANFREFVENTWIHKKILEMIHEINEGKLDSNAVELLMNKILFMSLKYGLVTPFSDVQLPVTEDNLLQLNHETSEDVLEMYLSDEMRQQKEVTKIQAGGDPHFLLSFPGTEFPFCFDLDNVAWKFVQLLSSTDFVMNIAIITSTQLNRQKHNKSYIGELYISSDNNYLLVTPEQILINGRQLQWNKDPVGSGLYLSSYHPNCIDYKNPRNIILTICRRLQMDGHPIDYLDIAIASMKSIGKGAGGFLGQAYKWPIKRLGIKEADKGVIGKFMIIKPGQRDYFHAKLKHRKIPTASAYSECWEMHRNVKTLLKEPARKFTKSTLFVK
ncbi:inter-alpha-trypsin inhibitor heavy chain H3-like isoform X1 [Saccostrea echinata]|uniref:inter-alpha-trypsin inhibitor heavy chain H3-like isoform X1 n=1 Tax=Saccostrea echinata TaxID=191078 RepID=UPI002A808F23|nr:inter-alpha-trypsin inhibitor heavy chain H3-like isoform X1 [Saccostrea echinata]